MSHYGNDGQLCPAEGECNRTGQYWFGKQDYPFDHVICGNGSYRDIQSDIRNCGSCGHACVAGQHGISGTCTNSCQAGATDCQNDGACGDPMIDPRTGGACGNSCALAYFAGGCLPM